MSIELDPRYQIEAYNSIKGSLEKTKRAGIIMPTGTGKSFLAIKLIEDSLESNTQILYVSPSPKINAQIRKTIRENYSLDEAGKMLSKIKFTTYHGMQRRFKEHKEDMVEYNSDTIILDEVHRSGAEEWGKAVDYLLENNPEANVLGMTATPLRNDGQDMIEKRCGDISYELKVSEAVARGILKLPVYISARHISNDEIISLEEKLELIEDDKERRDLERKLQKVKKQIENGRNLSEVYEKHLKHDGKYIVFCNPGDDIEKLQEQAEQEGTFDRVNKKQKYYIVESSRGEEKNQVALDGFERNEEGILKLLYAKNMLNEGYHHEDLTGEIMARPTKSYILFVQQLGRVLSKSRGKSPIVLDLVGNIRYFKEFRLEVQEIIKSGIARGETVYDEKVLESFKILEEQEDFIKAFEQIEKSIKDYISEKSLRTVLEIENWCKTNFEDKEKWDRRLPANNSEDKEERQLGNALKNLRGRLKQYEGKKIEEVEDEEDRRILEIVRRLDEEYAFGRQQLHGNLGNALKIEDWCKTNFGDKEKWDRRLPSRESEDKEEKQLSFTLKNLKRGLKKYEGKKREEVEDDEDRRILEIVRRLDEEYAFGRQQMHENLGNALKIEDWCKTNFEYREKWDRRLPTGNSEDKEEKQLSTALHNLRTRLKQYEGKKLEEVEDDEDRRILEIVRRLDEEYAFGRQQMHENLGNALKIEDWCKTNFGDKEKWDRRLPSMETEDKEEKQLGTALSSLRTRLKQYEGKKLEEVEDEEDRRVLEIIRRLDEGYAYGYQQMHKNLGNALKIENWCKTNFENREKWDRRLPSRESEDKEEKNLGVSLGGLRYRLKQYKGKELEEVEDEEDRRVLEIVRRLDEEYAFGQGQLHGALGNVLKIENWCKTNFGDKEKWDRRLPNNNSKDKEEKQLATNLTCLKRTLKQYEGMQLGEVEDEEDRRVLEIVRRLNEEYAFGHSQIHESLGNVLKIENWCKTNFGDKEKWDRRLPSSISKNHEEKQLGTVLGKIRTRLKQYEGMKLEEVEDEEDRRILEIVRRIDEEYNPRKAKQQDLLQTKKNRDEAKEKNDKAKELQQKTSEELKKRGKKHEEQ